jgi:hypothetical protein
VIDDDIAIDPGLLDDGPGLSRVCCRRDGLRLRGRGSRQQRAECNTGVQQDHDGFRLCHGVIPSCGARLMRPV